MIPTRPVRLVGQHDRADVAVAHQLRDLTHGVRGDAVTTDEVMISRSSMGGDYASGARSVAMSSGPGSRSPSGRAG